MVEGLGVPVGFAVEVAPAWDSARLVEVADKTFVVSLREVADKVFDV